MSQIVKRIITAVIFGSIVVFSIIVNQFVFALLIYCALIVAFIEFKTIANTIAPPVKLSLNLILGTFFYWLVFALMYFNFDKIILLILFFWLLFLLQACFTVFSKNKRILNHLKNPFFPALYIAFPLAILNSNDEILNNFNIVSDVPVMLLFFIFTIWLYDIFAYLSGISLGKHKLCKRLSPQKTWEGLIGGTIITIIIFVILSIILKNSDFLQGLIGVLIIVGFATTGDLFESFLKRNAKMKDSGNLLPGHGGVLDRFDSIFFAAPVFYLYCVIITYRL